MRKLTRRYLSTVGFIINSMVNLCQNRISHLKWLGEAKVTVSNFFFYFYKNVISNISRIQQDKFLSVIYFYLFSEISKINLGYRYKKRIKQELKKCSFQTYPDGNKWATQSLTEATHNKVSANGSTMENL